MRRQQSFPTTLALAGLFTLLPLTGSGCQDLKPHDEERATEKQTETVQEQAGTTEPQEQATPEQQRREPPPLLSGAHILVAYKGAKRAGPDVTRSKEEAKKLAQKLAKQARKNTNQFAELAKEHSNGPSARKGGSLGAWRKGQMVPAFDKAIQELEMGEVSDPVETDFGYHVIQRQSPWLAGSHILIAYKGAARAGPDVTRSKEEAKKLAQKLAKQARKNTDQFADLAKEHSDGPSAPKGGSLGKWPRGRMVPAFDMAIDQLEVGGVSEPVETPFGYHVILKEDPDKVSR
jgi:parvulin-like peptidyl-prolyl isomerase